MTDPHNQAFERSQPLKTSMKFRISIASALLLAITGGVMYLRPDPAPIPLAAPVFTDEVAWMNHYSHALCEQLADPEPMTRIRAAESLGEMGRYIPNRGFLTDLRKTLDDPDQDVRTAAACSLSRLGYVDDRVAVVLGECIARGNVIGMRRGPSTREVIRVMDEQAVARGSRAAVPVIVKAIDALLASNAPLGDSDAQRVSSSLRILGDIGDPAAVPLLRRAVVREASGRGDYECRAVAIVALGRMGRLAADAIPDLVRELPYSELRSSNDSARLAGASLAKIGGIDPLLDAVKNRDAHAFYPAVQGLAFATTRRDEIALVLSSEVGRGDFEAAESLLALGDLARPALPQFLKLAGKTPSHRGENAAAVFAVRFQVEDQFFPLFLERLKSPDEAVVETAVIALGNLGPAAAPATSALFEILKSGSDRRGAAIYAAKALGLIHPDDPRVVPILIAGLDSPDGLMQETCAHSLALYGMAAKPAVPRLLKLRRDSGNNFINGRMGARWALQHMGPAAEEAVPELIEDVKNERDVEYAFKALVNIGPAAAARLSDIYPDRVGVSILEFGQPAIPFLVSKLGGSLEQQRSAAECLAAAKSLDVSLVPTLVDLLGHADSRIRTSACQCLGKMGTGASAAVGPLRKLLADSEPGVQFEAATAPSSINHAGAAPQRTRAD